MLNEPKPMSLSDITKALESAVIAVDGRKKQAEDAKKASDVAAADYARALAAVKDLHNTYTQHMSAVLSGHGQLHK